MPSRQSAIDSIVEWSALVRTTRGDRIPRERATLCRRLLTPHSRDVVGPNRRGNPLVDLRTCPFQSTNPSCDPFPATRFPVDWHGTARCVIALHPASHPFPAIRPLAETQGRPAHSSPNAHQRSLPLRHIGPMDPSRARRPAVRMLNVVDVNVLGDGASHASLLRFRYHWSSKDVWRSRRTCANNDHPTRMPYLRHSSIWGHSVQEW